MKLSKVFRAAKRELNRTSYICWAIEKTHAPEQFQEAAKQVVISRLGGRASLGSWLQDQGVPVNEITSTRMKAHRRAWLDLLIAEFEGKGQ